MERARRGWRIGGGEGGGEGEREGGGEGVERGREKVVEREWRGSGEEGKLAHARVFSTSQRRDSVRLFRDDITSTIDAILQVVCTGMQWRYLRPKRVDDLGVPYSLLCTSANQFDMRHLEPTLAGVITAMSAGSF